MVLPMIGIALHLPQGVAAAVVIDNLFAVGVVVADQVVDIVLRMNLCTVLGGGDDQIHDVNSSRVLAASVGEAPGKLRAGGGQHVLIERTHGLGVQLGILCAVCGFGTVR